MMGGGGVVIGINLGHDRSACLAADGRVRVAIAEERLSRRKHEVPVNDRGERYCSFPERSVRYCLDACDLTYADVDLVVASTTYVLDTRTGRRRCLVPDDVRGQCRQLARTPVEVVGHHLAHAASAAPCAGFDSAAVLVVDGGGSIVRRDVDGAPTELERTTVFRFRDGELTPLHRVTGGPPAYGNSIGDFYQLITAYLGFGLGEEGKTMGLAAYRDMAAAAGPPSGWSPLEPFRGAITVDPNGSHSVVPELQFAEDGGFHPRLREWWGPPRPAARADEPLDRHIAASAQWALEGAMLELAESAARITGEARLCLSGGVALNCVANGRILREGPFRELFVQPAATDDGTALGNALLGWRMLSDDGWASVPLPYLGRPYRDAEIAAAIAGAGGRAVASRCDSLPESVAADIARGRIVGLFRGGCEFGPRALGHRSILCDPRLPWMKDRLNARVKRREAFRPFAPLVNEERAGEFFAIDVPSPYMLLAASVRRPELVPAITHVDGSARVQTVRRSQEPFLWELISAFDRLTGVPVLLNTSLNVRAPIVETPEDAMRCFLDTGIDVLYLEDLRVTRAGSDG
jgi:carbamoyltransferase